MSYSPRVSSQTVYVPEERQLCYVFHHSHVIYSPRVHPQTLYVYENDIWNKNALKGDPKVTLVQSTPITKESPELWPPRRSVMPSAHHPSAPPLPLPVATSCGIAPRQLVDRSERSQRTVDT